MQLPSTTDGLRSALDRLGYVHLLDGLDLARPDIVQVLSALVDSSFMEGDRTAGDEVRRAEALSLIVRYPWRSLPRPDTRDAMQAAVEALQEAGELVGPGKPPARVMKVKEVDEEAGEVTLEPGLPIPPTEAQQQKMRARFELNQLIRKGRIPRLRYETRPVLIPEDGIIKGTVEVHVSAGLDSMEPFFNLPALLAERLHGSGFLMASTLEGPALGDLAALLGEALGAEMVVDEKARAAVTDRLLGTYIEVMGSDKPLYDYETFRRNPQAALEGYRDVLRQAGYTEGELSAHSLAVLMAKPSRDENAGLIKKYAQMFYSATLGAPAAQKNFSRESYLAYLKDMRSRYPAVDLESPTFEQALQDEAERWWNARTLKGAGVDW